MDNPVVSTKRILSISGGGIKGVFASSFLSELEEAIKAPVAKFFDMIVGTSTGGIIALALGLGFSARDTLAFYKQLGPRIFRRDLLSRLWGSYFVTKYKSEALRDALNSTFGDRLLGESKVRLVIPSLNLETGEVHVFKTSHHPRLERDWRLKAAKVAIATSSAPTYFPAFRGVSGLPLVDGGVWANNPVGAAAVEAVGLLGWDRESVRILSVECPAEPLDVGAGRLRRVGRLYWAMRITDVFMSGQSSASVGTAQLLVGRKNVFRVSPMMPPGRFSLDGVREIESLCGLGHSEARKALPELRKVFFYGPTDEFELFHR